MKQWNLGNTTVRNPERIKAGLKVLSDNFVGKKFDTKVQDDFFNHLIEAGVVTGDPARSASRAQSGRKWASAFNQLGLAICWERKEAIEITAPGRALLSDDVLDEDVFLRQLLKVQIPSPIDRGGEGFSIHPLWLVLKCAFELHRKGLGGLGIEEIALFVVTTLRNTDADGAIERITDYRNERNEITGRVAKRRFFNDMRTSRVAELYGEELRPRLALLHKLLASAINDHSYLKSDEAEQALKEITTTGKGANVRSAVEARRRLVEAISNGQDFEVVRGIVEEQFFGRKGNTLTEYADTAVRYSRISGLFTITGDKLVIKEDQLALAERILAQGVPTLLEGDDFIKTFYDPSLPALPTDSQEFLVEDVKRLRDRAKGLGVESEVEGIDTSGSVLELRSKRQKLENVILLKKEEDFYRAQSSREQIQDIKDTFDKIANREIIGGSDYYPAWAEWAMWRVFLSINTISNPIEDTRNFRIDTDLYPIHHAKGGVADTVFEYPEDVIVPAETTLVVNERQYNMEGEPVQTHVLHIADANINKKVIGVLIAPAIHPRTAQSYFSADEWSERRGETVKLNIVPLTVAQLLSFLPGEANGCSSSSELIKRLSELLELRSKCSNGSEWLSAIAEHLSLASPVV